MSRSKVSPSLNSPQKVRASVLFLVLAGVAAAVFSIMYFSSNPKQEETAAVTDRKQNELGRPTGIPRQSGEKKERPQTGDARVQKGAKKQAKGAQGALSKETPAPTPVDAQASEKIIAEVMQALDNPDDEVRQSALERLEELKVESLNAPLQKALRDASEEVREKAMEVMGEIRSPEIIPSLETALSIGDEQMRESALDILEDIEDPRSIDAIIESGFKDTSASIREAAFNSLEWLTEMEFRSYEEAKSWWSANRDSFKFQK
jgi:hypothetical protein